LLGRGGGIVVSAHAYCSEELRWIPAGYKMFIIVRKDENKQIEAGVCPLKKTDRD